MLIRFHILITYVAEWCMAIKGKKSLVNVLFHTQDLISHSTYYLPHNSENVTCSSENLALIPKLLFTVKTHR